MKPAHLKYLSEAKVKQRWSAIVLTVYGMRRSVRDSRGAKRRWGSHFSYLSKAKVKRRWYSNSAYRLRYWNDTSSALISRIKFVATVLTVYGIETLVLACDHFFLLFVLQQCLPFTVLKHVIFRWARNIEFRPLQQHLPFTVLKRDNVVFTLCRFQLQQYLSFTVLKQITSTDL